MSEIAFLTNPGRLIVVGNAPKRKRKYPPYPRGKAKIKKVMREFRKGKLRSGRTGKKVTKASQARVIALSEQRRSETMAHKKKNKRRRMTAAQRKYFGKRSNPRHKRHRKNEPNPKHRRRYYGKRSNPRRRHHRRNAPNLRGILEPALYGLIGFAAPPYLRRFAAKYFTQLSGLSPYVTAIIDGGIGYALSLAGEKVVGKTNAGNMMIGTGILVGVEAINAVAAGTVTLGNVPYSFPASVASPRLGLYPQRIGLGARPDAAPSQFNIAQSKRYSRY
jgi:hypothetical protein